MSAVFSVQTQRSIRNRGMAALYGIAAENDCDVSDVLDLLVTTSMTSVSGAFSPFVRLQSTAPDQQPSPSQPKAAAASAPPSDASTGGEVSPPCTDPSVEPIQPETAEPVLSTDGANAGGGNEALVPPPAAETDKPGEEPASSPAPSLREQIVRCHAANPTWTARMIARHLGASHQKVSTLALGAKLTLPTQPEYDAARQVETAKALAACSAPEPVTDPRPLTERFAEAFAQHPDWTIAQFKELIGGHRNTIGTYLANARTAAAYNNPNSAPRPTPQTPVAPPSRSGRTLTDRVRLMHQQHSTWTARMIANELGANPGSVSAILAGVRGEERKKEEQPKFANRAAMVAHYGEVAKRLGKAGQ